MNRSKRLRATRADIISLWEFLKHGDETHKMRLLDAIEAWFEERQRPPVK